MDKELAEILSNPIEDKNDRNLVQEYQYLQSIDSEDEETLAKYIELSFFISVGTSIILLLLFFSDLSQQVPILPENQRLQLLIVLFNLVIVFILSTNVSTFNMDLQKGKYNQKHYKNIQKNIDRYGYLQPKLLDTFGYMSFNYIITILYINNKCVYNSQIKHILFRKISKENNIFYRSCIDILKRMYIEELKERNLIENKNSEE